MSLFTPAFPKFRNFGGDIVTDTIDRSTTQMLTKSYKRHYIFDKSKSEAASGRIGISESKFKSLSKTSSSFGVLRA